MTRVLILFVLVLLTGNIYAQTETDETEWKLPPLQTLIDSALVYSPLIQSADFSIQMSEFQLTDIRRNWLQKLNLGIDSRIGSMLDYQRMMSLSGGSFIPVSANIYMLNYGLGFSAYLPFSDIFDRKRQIQKAQLQVELSRNQKAQTEQQVKSAVIAAYYDVLSAQKTLATRNEISASASILNDQSKLDYTENRISLADYIRANDAYLTALNELELQKYALLKAVCVLEIIVGIQLIK